MIGKFYMFVIKGEAVMMLPSCDERMLKKGLVALYSRSRGHSACGRMAPWLWFHVRAEESVVVIVVYFFQFPVG